MDDKENKSSNNITYDKSSHYLLFIIKYPHQNIFSMTYLFRYKINFSYLTLLDSLSITSKASSLPIPSSVSLMKSIILSLPVGESKKENSEIKD